LAALIEKAPRDLPLYAPYVLRILNIILRNHDITMVESSIPTFEAFCEHHDVASLSADQEYLRQYEEIVKTYASFASTRSSSPSQKGAVSAPVAMRWRNVGLQAIKSVASSDALASVAGRQLHVIVPILLENLWTDNEDFIDLIEHRAQLEEKVDAEKLLRRRTSIATVRTAETLADATLSQTTADADKVAEEDIGVSAIQCLRQIFVANNRSHINIATVATLDFIAERVRQRETVMQVNSTGGQYHGWAIRIFGLIARWTPVQDRYVILVSAMDTMVRSPLTDDNMMQQLVLATMIDSLLKSEVNLIGLSVMDVLLGLIQHVLKVLQLDGGSLHTHENGVGTKEASTNGTETASVPTDMRKALLDRLQNCMADLATHVYYADQISDMVSAILLRLKPSPLSGVSNAAVAIENPAATSAVVNPVGELSEDPNTDGFFSFDTAKITALQAIKAIILVASSRKNMTGGGGLSRNRVPVRVWEGTQWLLRDTDGRVRKAYVDALLTWLDREMTKSDLRAFEEKPKGLTKTHRDDSSTSLSKRAVSNASHRDKPARSPRTTFLPLLHLAVYENAVQYIYSEADIVLLHLLLASLVERLGVNAVKNGLPMIFRLQEDILDAETPIAKIRMGSLCHGYFWALSEKFDFDTSPTGKAIQTEILRRQSKSFWIDSIRFPPIRLDQISTPGQDILSQTHQPSQVELESLKPFDDRFQMVKLISLSYAEALSLPAGSPPTSPGRSFSHPILSASVPDTDEDRTMPEKIKDQMMSEWSRDLALATVQEGSKTVSLNGSKTGTNITGHRNFLAVNGNVNSGGTVNSGSQSLHGHHQTNANQRNGGGSTYGLVGGLGALQKLRKGSGNSPSPASDSSRNSVTRVDQLKRVLSGQPSSLPVTRGAAHSDASSESMVSYDYTASEVSFDASPQPGLPLMERSVSMREPRDRARSKSRDRAPSNGEHSRPLTSNPLSSKSDLNVPYGISEDFNAIPPVPPLPSSISGDGTSIQDHALTHGLQKGRSVRRSSKSKGGQTSSTWGDDVGPAVDLESLLKGIDTEKGDWKGNVAKPPY
jgi:hypothetical protein